MTTTPAPTDVDTLKALLDAMPEGPWRVAQSLPNPGIRTAAGWEVLWATYADTGPKVLEFIAAARNALPALLDELAESRSDRDAARNEADMWQRQLDELTKSAGRYLKGRVTESDTWEKRYAEMLDQRDAALHQLTEARAAAVELEPLSARAERDAAREELAKTRAELDDAQALIEGYAELLKGQEDRAERNLASSVQASNERDAARAQTADATILLIEAVQHGGLPIVLRQRINGFLAEANPATTAEPAATVHGYTAHGHPCCGQATVGSRPASRARCGGVDMCRDCQAAAGRIHGNTPAQVQP